MKMTICMTQTSCCTPEIDRLQLSILQKKEKEKEGHLNMTWIFKILH